MQLKILLWNLQDFFIFMDYYKDEDLTLLSEAKWQTLTTSLKNNKELTKLHGIKEFLNSASPDICLFTEVGGLESLSNFNTYFLDDRFDIHHFPSNSSRGIDLGIYTTKSLQQKVESKFYQDKEFARGLQQLNINLGEINLQIFLTHLKSKLNLEGKDFEGRDQRMAETNKIVEIITEQNKLSKYQILAGDLNGIIYKNETEPELANLTNKLGFKDYLEVLNHSVYNRCTYVYFNNTRPPALMQLDYILLNSQLWPWVDADCGVLDFDGNPGNIIPKDRKQRDAAPSDHFPLLLKLNLKDQ